MGNHTTIITITDFRHTNTKIFVKIIRFQIMIQRFEAILVFYQPFFFWSFAINILIIIINPSIVAAVLTKLFLTLILRFLMNETSSKKSLVFYKNLGLSNLKLFSSMFLIDISISITFLLVMREFI